ncbi:MAG: thiamine-binding protein [Atribacterota bacterium]|nr:thiamine-binding protein [Atribacterota bacterium]
MAKITLGLQVLPYVPEEKLYQVVDKVIAYIDSCRIKYEVSPMETTMKGELDDLLAIVKKAQEICIEEGASRVVSLVKIDYKKTGVTIDEKVGKYKR